MKYKLEWVEQRRIQQSELTTLCTSHVPPKKRIRPRKKMPFCWNVAFAFCKVGPRFFHSQVHSHAWFIEASIGLGANTNWTILWYFIFNDNEAKRGRENWTHKEPTLNLWKWSNLERKPKTDFGPQENFYIFLWITLQCNHVSNHAQCPPGVTAPTFSNYQFLNFLFMGPFSDVTQ